VTRKRQKEETNGRAFVGIKSILKKGLCVKKKEGLKKVRRKVQKENMTKKHWRDTSARKVRQRKGKRTRVKNAKIASKPNNDRNSL